MQKAEGQINDRVIENMLNWHHSGFNVYCSNTYWLALLANSVYAILFFLAAVIAILGFIKLQLRKRAYQDEYEDEDF